MDKRRLRRLEREAVSTYDVEQVWMAQAMRLLTTPDLELIEGATSLERRDTILSPAERAAFERLQKSLEEVKRCMRAGATSIPLLRVLNPANHEWGYDPEGAGVITPPMTPPAPLFLVPGALRVSQSLSNGQEGVG